MTNYQPKEGDRVRVVLEGRVEYTYPRGNFMLNTNGIYPDQEHVVSVEKIDPPVEVFKPGDVCRERATGELRTPLPEGGWFNLTRGEAYPTMMGGLTSKKYDLVFRADA